MGGACLARPPVGNSGMAGRVPTILLWLTLVLCAPLPYFLIEVGRQPVAAVMQMLAVTLTLIVAEGSSGALPLTAWILGIQVLIGLLVLALAARLAMRLIERLFAERAALATWVLIFAIVSLSLSQPIYVTPFRATGLHATLAEVFE